MKKNHALMMALSALSAGLLISCVKPAEDTQTAEVNSQEVAKEGSAQKDMSSGEPTAPIKRSAP